MSTARAAWLLVRLRVRRLVNLMRSSFRRRRRAAPGQPRRATGTKRGVGLMTVMFAPLMFLSALPMASQIVRQIEQAAAGQAQVDTAVALVLGLLVISSLLMGVATRELAAPEWDMEWLVTLPVPLRSLIDARMVERSVVNVWAAFLLWPFTTVLSVHWGVPVLLALPAGLLLALPLLALVGAVRTLCETGLRLRLSPDRLRNLQAVLSLAALLSLYATFVGEDGEGGWLLQVVPFVQGWQGWLPAGLVVRLVHAPGAGAALAAAGLLVAEVTVVVLGCRGLLAAWLRGGVVTHGARESGRRAASPARSRRSAPGSRLLSPVQRRDLRLLARDRTFLMQTMVVPVLLIGAQFMMHKGSVGELLQQPRMVGLAAFVVAAYCLMYSAFQTLLAEGKALWILFTLPRPLTWVLRQKAGLWALLALVYPVAILVAGLVAGPARITELLGYAAYVLLGVPVFAMIATCLGVFGCNPLATERQARIRPGYSYAYLLLMGLFTAALFAPDLWQRIVLLVLLALLALALWQKAGDRLVYLLDPTEAPPSAVSLSDGLIAALVFFVVQALIGLALVSRQVALGPAQLVAYCGAGLVTVGAMAAVFARLETRGVPTVVRGLRRGALPVGVGLGLLAGAVGVGYLLLVRSSGVSDSLPSEALRPAGGTLWLAVLAVLAAPVLEEVIFRGLVFGGLRRTLPFVWAALASAAVFALVHPPVGAPAVFVLGLAAALAYERGGGLLAPMLTHATYNLIVVVANALLFPG